MKGIVATLLILLYVCHHLFIGEMRIFFMKLRICVYIDASFLLRGKCLLEQEMAAVVTSYFNEINLYLQFAVIWSFHHSAALPRCSLSTAAGPLLLADLCASGPQQAQHPDVVTYSHTFPMETCQCGHTTVIN